MPISRRRTGAWLRRIDPLIGPIAAVVLAAATFFFCFALPDRIVSPWLTIVGLPPTVGARAGLALIEAVLTGLGTWGLFRLFDLPRAAVPAPLALTQDAAPVLRRADAHPDAPARRPIFAGSDLGTPFDLLEPEPLDWGAVSTEVLPRSRFSVLEEADPGLAPVPAASTPPAARPAVDAVPPPLPSLTDRLEKGLARKAAPGEDDAPRKRELPPFDGDLGDAVDRIERGTGRR